MSLPVGKGVLLGGGDVMLPSILLLLLLMSDEKGGCSTSCTTDLESEYTLIGLSLLFFVDVVATAAVTGSFGCASGVDLSSTESKHA